MDVIVMGRSPTSNALLVYNPRNWQYYEPVLSRLLALRNTVGLLPVGASYQKVMKSKL
jgi:hypothetical protein